MRFVAFLASIAVAGCGPTLSTGRGGPPGNDGGSASLDLSPSIDLGPPTLDVEPSTPQTINVIAGQTMPTVDYVATYGGAPVNVAWSVDRSDAATVAGGPSSNATVTPSGGAGGLVTVSAGLNGMIVKRQIVIQLSGTQSGANPMSQSEQSQIPSNVAALKAGGGVGGVGGEGLGPAVTDGATLNALQNPMGNGQAQGLALVYPYDATVWPRGLNAPLLMWSWSIGDADAIEIQLTTASGSFTYKGTFGRPAILAQTHGPFIRHPIPQDVWDMATATASAPTLNGNKDKLTVQLTVARGGVAYGPISETWTVANARLTGTVYYNSYGTQLVRNWVNPDGAGHPVGAAILGVRSGDAGPTLVVGQNSPLGGNGIPTNDSGCRVCHVVASRGRWLLTQSELGNPNDGRSFLYDLKAANVQGSVVQLTQEGVFAWAAMTGDGSHALTNTVNPSSSNPAVAGTTSTFWSFGPSPQQATLSGLPSGVAAGYPSYSPDDKLVAYIDVTGSTQSVMGGLVVAPYDSTKQTFGGTQMIRTPQSGQRIGYPAFLPDDSGVVFETELRKSQTDSVMVTRNGARSELWWITLGNKPQAAPLAALNGKNGAISYLPIGMNNHGIAGARDPRSSYDETGWDDSTLNYEPTVLPIVAGGYAWVVFTSRRMYGNQLTAVPWQSWPPDYDTTNLGQATVKKLWVAAIDLGARGGADPSHPAFYLPAQEILAGNSRGFWVLDPCRPDGQSCDTGDQCCGGYCEPGMNGQPMCTDQPPNAHCSGLQEKCNTAADCCDQTNLCINGFCAQGIG